MTTKLRAFIEEQRKHNSELKLSSDDHGHNTDDLRIYCELELSNYADNVVPKLLDAVEMLNEALDQYSDGELTPVATETLAAVEALLTGEEA